MLETILELLRQADTDGWEVTDETISGWEFYFIRHALDQNRARDVRHINVRVYKKFGEYLGSAGAEIPVSADRAQAEKQIALLIEEAKLVKNPVYKLNVPKEAAELHTELPELSVMAKDFIEVLGNLEETETEDLNSYEIFVNRVNRRFLNSNGIDVTTQYPTSLVEVVINARQEEHEIELYRMYRCGTCDREGLKSALLKTMQFGKDRLKAGKTPNLGTCDVVFSTDAALQIYEYMADQMSTSMKYRGLSSWEIGKPAAEDADGDLVTLKAVRELPNSSNNRAYDLEGAPIRDLTLIEDGIAKAYWGRRQFSQYLGVEDSFSAGNFTAEGGTHSVEELRQGTFLEAVEFSDFQVDSVSGNIAGEIRLAYLHEGDKVSIVSGGSVSGSMLEFMKHLRISREQKQYNNFRIPSVTRLKDVTVTGAE